MKAKMLLRIAAVFIVIHLFGHCIGSATWDQPADPQMKDVVNAMKAHKAGFMGATKSLANYYVGYSWITSGLYVMTIFLLWFASGFIDGNRGIAKKVLYPIGFMYLYFGAVEYIGFFPFAAAMSFFAGVLVLLALQKR